LPLGGAVRKGEHGSLVVFASTFSRTEANESTGEESERDIPDQHLVNTPLAP
jgi:antirestriction protein ArdC